MVLFIGKTLKLKPEVTKYIVLFVNACTLSFSRPYNNNNYHGKKYSLVSLFLGTRLAIPANFAKAIGGRPTHYNASESSYISVKCLKLTPS